MHYQLGNFDECVTVKKHLITGDIQGQYCLADISVTTQNHLDGGIVKTPSNNEVCIILK